MDGKLRRRLMVQKKQSSGLDPPQSSLKFSMKDSHNYHAFPREIQVKYQTSGMSLYDSSIPVKTANNRKNAMSTTSDGIAHFPGMKMLPSEVSTIQNKECKDENARKLISRKEPFKGSTRALCLIPLSKTKEELVLYGKKKDFCRSSRTQGSLKPMKQEQQREEQLQKLKKEFQASLASKVWEHARTVEQKNSFQLKKVGPILQENHTDQFVRYTNTRRVSEQKKSINHKDCVSTAKFEGNKQGELAREGHLKEHFQSSLREGTSSRIKIKTKSSEQLPVARLVKKQDRFCSGSKIVILKPTYGSSDIEQTPHNSSEIMERDLSRDDFLKEVKKRLKFGMQGKARNASTTGGSGILSSVGERSSEPKRLARNIAKHIKEIVRRDLERMLIQSKSTKSFSKVAQANGEDSLQLTNSKRSKKLSEKLVNLLKTEKDVNYLVDNGKSGSSHLIRDRVRSNLIFDSSKMQNGINYWEDKNAVAEWVPVPSGCERENSLVCDVDPALQQNLVKPSSDPVLCTAFAELLLDDRHVPWDVQICRKLKASEYTLPVINRNRKVAFDRNVSAANLRRNFTLGGKLLHKKTQSGEELALKKFDSEMVISITSADVMDLCNMEVDSSDLPPSPTSLSSFSPENFQCSSHLSPVPPVDDNSSSRVFGEVATNLPELMSLPEKESRESLAMSIKVQASVDEIVEVLGYSETHMDRTLASSRLYDDMSYEQIILRGDTLTTALPQSVFDRSESSYINCEKADNAFSPLNHSEHCKKYVIPSSALYDCMPSDQTISRGKSLTNATSLGVFEEWEKSGCKHEKVDIGVSLTHSEAYLKDILANSWLHDIMSSDQAISWGRTLTNPIPQCAFEQWEEGYSKDEKVDNFISSLKHSVAYIKHILVSSGLYNSMSCDQAISRRDTLPYGTPLCAFDELEKAYSKYLKMENYLSPLSHPVCNIAHKMIFDLMKESLPIVLRTPFTISKLKSWSLGQITVLQGKELLDYLLHQISIYTTSVMDKPQCIETMVARDVRMTSWSSMSHGYIDLAGREIELMILDELIDEFVQGMLSY